MLPVSVSIFFSDKIGGEMNRKIVRNCTVLSLSADKKMSEALWPELVMMYSKATFRGKGN